jgi:predicted RNase H-like HicB family nuclease
VAAKGGDAVKFLVAITPDQEDGGFVAECLSLPGCFSQGETQEEALANIAEAIEGVLLARKEQGLPIPGKEELPVLHEVEVAV